MANVKTGGLVMQQSSNAVEAAKKKSVSLVFSELLDSSGMKARINELLGKRAPQFVGSLVSIVNADKDMQEVFQSAPLTIIQAGLRAAIYDLPIDAGLGYAYIVPFRNKGRMEATFILGYKGMLQLAMRTGAYKKINVVDVREGELKRFDRLTEDVEIYFIEDEEERNKLPIVGYCGYFRLVNGMEKFIYMSVSSIEAHERRHRKGQFLPKPWRIDKDAMCRKTVLRHLIGKWGVMSIDYQAAPSVVAATEAIAKGEFDDDDKTIDIGIDEPTEHDEPTEITEELDDGRSVDTETGELFGGEKE